MTDIFEDKFKNGIALYFDLFENDDGIDRTPMDILTSGTTAGTITLQVAPEDMSDAMEILVGGFLQGSTQGANIEIIIEVNEDLDPGEFN